VFDDRPRKQRDVDSGWERGCDSLNCGELFVSGKIEFSCRLGECSLFCISVKPKSRWGNLLQATTPKSTFSKP